MLAVLTATSMALVPLDPTPRTELRTSAWMMTAGLLVVPLWCGLQNWRTVLRAEHLLLLSPVFWLLLDPLQAAYDLELVGEREVKLAFLAIGLFGGGIWLSCLHRAGRVPRIVLDAASDRFPVPVLFAIGLIAFGLCMLKYAIPCQFNPITMFYYVGQNRWAAPWGRGQFGGWDAFLDHLSYFGFLAPLVAVLLAARVGWSNWRTLTMLAMGLIITLFQTQSGGRRIIGVMFGSAVLLRVLQHRRLRLGMALGVTGVIALTLYLMSVMLDYRNVGLRGLFDPQRRAETGESTEKGYYHVDDNFLRLAQMIRFIPGSHPHVGWQYPAYILARPIPRVFWPGKPVDPGFDLPEHLGAQGVSLSCSVIGELYMAFGLVGVLAGGWIYGLLGRMASALLTMATGTGGYVLYSAAVMALFGGGRSAIELVLMSYVLLAWIASVWAQRFFHGPATIGARLLSGSARRKSQVPVPWPAHGD
jgi:hypothetical protein